ncbi:phage baseplate assembly protein V, partial [Bergeyella sp. RCAD1439]|uniref:phage baseplate assembly protein V n=1 Tax=Bergeyella anatis TaxID=3113737 RepID=UPI002E177E65|nr:phage baseplate assembly protein V [Bergeyella sp. RCAD1439]
EDQPAIVKDNNDPQGLGRVRVQFIWQRPTNEYSPWIRVVQPHGGSGKGFYFIPEIDEEVMVSFENQNAERPYVIGSHYNGKSKSGYVTKDNSVKVIQTRSGHIVKFTEDESIIITDKSGNEIRLDTQGANINITAPQNISLNAGNNVDINVGNNLSFNVGNTALLNILQKTLINTPFMQQLVSDYFHTQAGKALINSENEIKIEARETNVAGTQKLLMHSDEEATINSKEKVSVKGESGTSHSNVADDYETQKEEIQPKCLVKFRPHDKWQGEFGFDWLRGGDSGQEGDIWFGNIMGRYYNETSFSTLFKNTNTWSKFFKKELDMYNRKLRSYTNLQINWKSIKGKPYLYPVPILTLLKGHSATFNLKTEIEEVPKKLTFEFKDKEAEKCLKLNVKRITGLQKGKKDFYNYIKITCINSFSKQHTLLVKADDKVCGAMKIHPNSPKYIKHIKVIFVRVKTNINGSEVDGKPYNNAEQFLKIHLNQALVTPDIRISSKYLNCTDSFFKAKFCSQVDGKYEITNSTGLKEYLETKFNEQFGKTHYQNYYKLFFIGEAADWNGFSFPGSKFAVYSASHNEGTIAHEIMHAMGLPHTFASVDEERLKAKFTYEALKTNNLMDYSHWNNIPRITTYHWQWRQLNPRILPLK